MTRSVGRNVFGEVWKESFKDLQLSSRTVDGAMLAASADLVLFCVEGGAGGTVGVVKLEDCGVRKPTVAMFRGHKGPVHDLQFSPFYSTIFATASEDATIKLWDCHQATDQSVKRDAVATLTGHDKKVCFVSFNMSAEWIVASCGIDCTIRIWDFETLKCARTATASHPPNCLRWNYDSSLVLYTTRNSLLKVLDPRVNNEVLSVKCHEGAKPTRAEWIPELRASNDDIYLLSAGFSRMADREIALWDLRNSSECVSRVEVDRQSGIITPVYDMSTGLLFISGKGDGNVRFFEVKNGTIETLDNFATSEPARDLAFAPKRAMDVMRCEVMRAYKAQANNVIQPISFIVPKRNMSDFHSDLFPPCFSGDAAITAEEWVTGKTAEPILKSMEPINGVTPFSSQKRPLDTGSLAFGDNHVSSDPRTNTAVRASPSVLVKQITAQELMFDKESDALRERIAILENALRDRDRRISMLETALNEPRTPFSPSLLPLGPAASDTAITPRTPHSLASTVDELSLKQTQMALKATSEQAEATISELRYFREEVRAARESGKQTNEELRRIAAELHTSTHKTADGTARTAGSNSSISTGQPGSTDTVHYILKKMKDLERRNKELEDLLIHLRVASRTTRRHNADSSDLEIWVTSEEKRYASTACGPGVNLCGDGWVNAS